MPLLPRLTVAVLIGLACVGHAQTADPIDFDKARGIMQRISRGEEVTAEERAYFEKARAARAAQSGQSSQSRAQAGPPPAKPATGFVPLTDLKAAYKGEDGGLYGAGRNEPPEILQKAGSAAAAKITPLDKEGKPSPSGKIVLLSVGMSNTTQEFSAFVSLAKSDSKKNPAVMLVDGAQGGQTADRIAKPDAPFWGVVDKRLTENGVTAKQVQAIWLKEAFAGPRESFPTEAKKLAGYLNQDVAVIRQLFPNIRLIFLSSRIYAGYATTGLNPEPHAYEGAFAIRWVIQEQLKEDGLKSGAPALLWGPYLWADGEKGRAAGDLVWKPEDFGPDGTHPSQVGRQKVADLLSKFFHSSPFATVWYEKK